MKTIKVICENCDGIGKVKKKEHEHITSNGYVIDYCNCSLCNGNGYYKKIVKI